jgi:hypothetical protein
MAADQSLDNLLTTLQQTVESTSAHFRQLEAESKIRMGVKSPRETLCHLVWWHQATVEGMESVVAGGAPYRIYASTREMNARALGRFAGQTASQLTAQLPALQARLEKAARALPGLQTPVFMHADGTTDSAAQRLEDLIQHWSACSTELQAV